MDKILPRNEHTVERVVRVAIGIGLLAIAFVGPKTPWGYLGIIPLLTGLLGSCPLYTLFGFSTCPMKKGS
ncbi:MAG: YgaP family membrane protein [Longimicrobiales bacterium]